MQEARSGVLWYARGLETAACPAKLKDSGGRTPSNAQSASAMAWRRKVACWRPLLVARRVLGEDMFAHNLTIRKPLPTGVKDWTKLGGYLHADWHHFTVNPFIGGRHYRWPSSSSGASPSSPGRTAPPTSGPDRTCLWRSPRNSRGPCRRGGFEPRSGASTTPIGCAPRRPGRA